MITGKDLIAMGYKPGKWFGDAIKEANERGLEGEELRQFIDSMQPPDPVEPHLEPRPIHYNIKADNEDEEANVEKVKATMNEVMRVPTVEKGAVMPDACPTGEIGQIPVGGVVSTKNAIHPAMHSADICCSVMMSDLGKADPKRVLDAAEKATHFGPGGRFEFCDLPSDFEDRIKSNGFFDDKSLELAQDHMATQGDGNHFFFVGFSERTGNTVIVTHHGSRGLGARLYKMGMKTAERFRRELSPDTMKKNAWIPFDEDEGKEYWEALQAVREWTKLNHANIHAETYRLAGVDPLLNYWNEHNFIFKDGDTFHHAKGATPIEEKFVPDGHEGLRIIPLNMAQPVLIVRGDTTDTNLGFAPHGAGRNISRSEHKRRHEGKSEQEIFHEETKALDVRFYCGEIDTSELPSAYKDAESVQRQIEEFGLGEVVDKIIPYGCIMAGDWKRNAPWKRK